jgi:hypothetical protein
VDEHSKKLLAIQFIRPNAEFILSGDELEWLDKKQKQPTEAEIAQGWVDYQVKLAAEKAEVEAKREAALNKLAALGLDNDDLKALGF